MASFSFALARPGGEDINKISSIRLLGSKAKLQWTQTPEGLAVTMPAQKPCDYAVTLRIEGKNLKPVEFGPLAQAVQADQNGALTLSADAAELHGDQINQEEKGGQPNIGFWDRPADFVSWKVRFTKAGAYIASANCAALAESMLVLEAAGQTVAAKVPVTGDWGKFGTAELGRLEIKEPTEITIALRPKDAATWKPVNLRWVKLAPVP
jgi:alpha-L-fucosidase